MKRSAAMIEAVREADRLRRRSNIETLVVALIIFAVIVGSLLADEPQPTDRLPLTINCGDGLRTVWVGGDDNPMPREMLWELWITTFILHRWTWFYR